MASAGSADTTCLDLAPFAYEAPQSAHVLVVDLVDLLFTERAVAPSAAVHRTPRASFSRSARPGLALRHRTSSRSCDFISAPVRSPALAAGEQAPNLRSKYRTVSHAVGDGRRENRTKTRNTRRPPGLIVPADAVRSPDVQAGFTFVACGPFRPCSTSNSTTWSSDSVSTPGARELTCTNTSFPLSCSMKP